MYARAHLFSFMITCSKASLVYGVCVCKFVFLLIYALEGQMSTSESSPRSNIHALCETVSLIGAELSH